METRRDKAARGGRFYSAGKSGSPRVRRLLQFRNKIVGRGGKGSRVDPKFPGDSDPISVSARRGFMAPTASGSFNSLPSAADRGIIALLRKLFRCSQPPADLPSAGPLTAPLNSYRGLLLFPVAGPLCSRSSWPRPAQPTKPYPRIEFVSPLRPLPFRDD